MRRQEACINPGYLNPANGRRDLHFYEPPPFSCCSGGGDGREEKRERNHRFLILVMATTIGASDQPAEPVFVNDSLILNGVDLPWKKGICKNEMQERPPKFQPERFFKGQWYEGKSLGTIFSDVYRKCITLNLDISDDVVNLTVSEYIPMFFWTVCQQVNIFLDSREPTSFMAKIPWLGMSVVELPVDILATDYDHYAILYSCSPALGLDGYISEFAFIFHRTRGDLSRNHEIRDICWRNGLVYEDFTSSDNDHCPKSSCLSS